MPLGVFLLPFFAQAALTFALLFLTGRRRLSAVKRGEVRLNEVALGQRAWPDGAQRAANAYMNQFELPTLFYALAPIAIFAKADGLVFVALAWMFVALRVAHAMVYLATNHVPTRFRVFVAGFVVLAAMWLLVAAQIYLRP